MLSECVRWCSERYGRVVATCNTEPSAASLDALAHNVVAVRGDWSQPEEWWRAVTDQIGDVPVALAVVWMHSTAGDLYQRIHTLIQNDGILVRIRGHATAKPGEGELAGWIDAPRDPVAVSVPNERHVVLGWQREHGGQWLSSDEIGAGIVSLMDHWLADDTASPVAWVGCVRPWESRPSGWS